MPTYRLKLYRGKFNAVWSDDAGRTQRQSLRTTDREEAERRLVDFRRDLVAPAGSTVGDYVKAYLDYKDGRVRDHVRLVGAWANALDTFGALRPDQITPQLCEEYTEHRRAIGRTPISAKLVANMIAGAGVHRVITVDLHTDQIQGFFDISTDNLYSAPVMSRDIAEHYDVKNLMIVSPDVGGVGRARAIAKRIGTDGALAPSPSALVPILRSSTSGDPA